MTKLAHTDAHLARLIYGAVCSELNVKVSKNLGRLTAQVRALITSTLNASREINELRNPDSYLVGVLGLERASVNSRVDALIRAIVDAADVRVEAFRAQSYNIKGYVRVSILKENYSELLGAPESTVTYEDGTYNWVNWLIYQSDRIILTESSVLWKPAKDLSAWSRQGHALIVPHTSKLRAVRIPAEFSGRPQDTMFDRAFTRNATFQDQLNNILYSILD